MEATTLELSDTPYPGLRPFRSDEADIFFGRERQTDDLLARLAAHRFLAVVGPSGCGKSSLVAAGLMPALATGFMATAGAHWRIAKLRPGERPMANLAAALVEARILDDERAAQPDAPVFLEAALRRGPLGLVEILRGAALAPDANLLVLVDQFEELFRFSAGVQRDEAEAFVALLLASAAAPRERIYIAITMRSDFLGECAPFHGLPEAINDGLYLAPRLTRDECAACITGPARVFGADVEPALVNRLLNDFGTDPDQLPLLQHAMLHMWNRHDRDRWSGAKTLLTVADYDAIGGLARSLSDHADEAFAELDLDRQRIAKRMVQRLSDSETARRDRRAPARVREIAELAGATFDDVRRVADVFRRRDRCFLTPREEIELMPDTVLDISHESLLRQWDKAVGWIEQEADTVTAYRRLRDAARAWRDGDALMTSARLDRALTWRNSVTATWALRYGTREDFGAVCEFVCASEKDRDERQRKRNHSLWMRKAIAMATLGTLAIASAIAWVVWPVLYVWEHTSYYASLAHNRGAPIGLGALTSDQLRHRPLSFRIITAGLFGHVKRVDAVNSRDELTEVYPEYKGTERGRHLTTSHWIYEYDAAGRIAAEYQYTRSDELVQGKIYVSRDTGDVRRAMFIDTNGTPVPVRGRSKESTYYWAEAIRYADIPGGFVESISYLGASGEPVPGDDRAFASQRVYDDRGYQITNTSLDASGEPMNGGAGNATMIVKNDEFGDLLEVLALDQQRRRTRIVTGWAMRRATFDAFGNEIEEAYFDENDQPILLEGGWHKQRLVRDDRGSVVETHYFDQDGKPTSDSNRCYGSKQQHDAMNRLVRWTCTDPAGLPRGTRYGIVTWTRRYDERGLLLEETTLDTNGNPTAGADAVATRLYGYDKDGRQVEVAYLGVDGKPVINGEGYGRSVTTYDDASRTEWTRFLGVDGQSVAVKEKYTSVQRKRDIWWNITEEHYYDDDDDPVITSDGSAGWRGTFDTRGQEIERVFLGKSGEAVLGKDGYAGWRAEYDGLGQKTAIHYLDLSRGDIANLADGVASWSARYDAWGNQIELEYFGLDGKPATSIHGEAGWRAEYDRNGHQTKRQYIDTEGAPTLRAWKDEVHFTGQGYALLERAFDAHGDLLVEAYFGVHDERIARPGSWSYATYVYDDLGRQARASYFGAKDEPVKIDGYHTLVWIHDKHGNAVELRYFDLDEKTPVLSSEGFALIENIFDQNHRVIENRVFGTHYQPVMRDDGYHRRVIRWDSHGRQTRYEMWGPEESPQKIGAMEFGYDRWGNTIEIRHLDANEAPLVTAREPCATRKWHFSDRRELLDEACFGRKGTLSPFLRYDAAHIMYSYGRPGEKATETFYNELDLPFRTIRRFAGIKYKHDLLGRETDVSYVDEHGNQVPTDEGYARVTKSYNARGDLVERAYFLANDNPTVPVAKIESEFDPLRRKVTDWFLGPGANPARLGGRGQHVTLYDYDEYGNVRGLRYLDARGRPTQGFAWTFDDSRQLCARWVAHYDDVGNLVGNGECLHDPSPPGPASSARLPQEKTRTRYSEVRFRTRRADCEVGEAPTSDLARGEREDVAGRIADDDLAGAVERGALGDHERPALERLADRGELVDLDVERGAEAGGVEAGDVGLDRGVALQHQLDGAALQDHEAEHAVVGDLDGPGEAESLDVERQAGLDGRDEQVGDDRVHGANLERPGGRGLDKWNLGHGEGAPNRWDSAIGRSAARAAGVAPARSCSSRDRWDWSK